MDFVARYQAKKHELLYPFCFDCNGLPTEKLAHKNRIFDPADITKFAVETSDTYRKLFSDIGLGFSGHSYHTYDELSTQIVLLSFEDLCQKGLAYKAETEFFFCPKTGISVSQSEVDDNGCFERSGAKVITKKGTGWFIKIMDHLPEIRKMVDAIQWHPDTFKNRLHRWLDDVKYDWSISRERKYGIQIPGEDNLVFDTWFTSSLTPQLTWAAHTGVASLECPVFDVRFQAHDIIRTWALFTIVKSLYHNKQIPWKNLVISGHALDKKGKKISKTAGNFVPPSKYLDQYGRDGIRYWTAHNQPGTDTKTDVQLMSKGKKLVNKLRNAHKFVWMRQEDIAAGLGHSAELVEEWSKTEEQLVTLMDAFKWGDTIHLLTDFFWHRFCDYWIEEGKKQCLSFSLHNTLLKIISWYEIFFPDLMKKEILA
jgi:valyl-tRNA synthetase